MASSAKVLLAAVAFLGVLELGLVTANFKDQCNITWGPQNAAILEEGDHLKLSMVSNSSGNISYQCPFSCNINAISLLT
jgi:xyloglucan:xyloglucosyl transferase